MHMVLHLKQNLHRHPDHPEHIGIVRVDAEENENVQKQK